jgi:hypothetical protein
LLEQEALVVVVVESTMVTTPTLVEQGPLVKVMPVEPPPVETGKLQVVVVPPHLVRLVQQHKRVMVVQDASHP